MTKARGPVPKKPRPSQGRLSTYGRINATHRDEAAQKRKAAAKASSITGRAPTVGDTVEVFYGCAGQRWKAYPVGAVKPESFTAGGIEYSVAEEGSTWRWLRSGLAAEKKRSIVQG